jgi:hypothetical protein
MLRTVVSDLFVMSERTALRVLAACAGLSVLIYALLFVTTANLLALYTKPLLDLLRILKSDPLAQWRLALGFTLLAGLYLLGWRALRHIHSPEARRTAWWIVIGAAVLSALILLYLYPFDAADIFDNIMHGRIRGIYGANPFQQVIAQFRADPLYSYAAWLYAPTAYGPGWELLAGLTARLAGNGIIANIIAFKLLPGFFLAASGVVVADFLREAAPERALVGVWLLIMNPIVLYETLGNGHNDIAMTFWIIAAVWMLYRGAYTRAALFLMIGGLFKYIPLLLLPAAVWVAFLNLKTSRERIRYLLVTGFVCALAAVILFAPFWQGLSTLSITRRENMLTTSLPSIIYQFFIPLLGKAQAASWVSRAALALTAAFAMWQAWEAGKEHSWLSFTRASLNILIFYLLVTCLWFQQWYPIWLVGLAVLLPAGLDQSLGLWIGFAALTKPLVFGPLVFLQRPPDPPFWLELRLSAGVMVLSWLGAWWVMWQKRRPRAIEWSTAAEEGRGDAPSDRRAHGPGAVDRR